MDPLEESIARTITARRLFRPGQGILVAVSGGVDSMVLLRLLHSLVPEQRWRLKIAHLNHKLRGRSSLADEQLVRRVSRQLGLPLIVESADVRGYASKHKLSVEMAARKLRQDFLARTARRLKLSSVALAHHADDQVELFFLRLLRGSGAEGLAGMKWRNPSPANPKVELVRPLLNVTKQTLAEYAGHNRVPFRHDATNVSQEFQRNLIRHELLPLLKRKYQSALNETVLRVMDILGGEAQFVQQVAGAWLERRAQPDQVANDKARAAPCRRPRKESLIDFDPVPPDFFTRDSLRPLLQRQDLEHLLGCDFAQLPVALQRRTLCLQLMAVGVTPGFELVERLRSAPGRAINLPGETRLQAVRDAQGLIRVERFEKPLASAAAETIVLTSPAGAASLGGFRLSWRFIPQTGTKRPTPSPHQELFDADKVGSPVVLRHWLPGDRFWPIGMNQPVKLQDFFTNQKVPRALRGRLVVAVTDKGELFWVEGMRISEPFKLRKETIRRLCWAWERV